MSRLAIAILITFLAGPYSLLAELGFRIDRISMEGSRVRLSYPVEEGYYYRVFRGNHPTAISELVMLTLSSQVGQGSVESSHKESSYYRVQQVAVDSAFDSDADELDDIVELSHPTILDPLDVSDADLDFDNDGKTNKEELSDLLAPSDPGDAVFQRIEFETSDRFKIVASLGVPSSNSTSVPAVIFIHQGGSTRKEWESVAKKVFREGWVTLAYDIRGHGESSGQWSNTWYDDPTNAPNDLKAAIVYLKAIGKVDAKRIAVVGASVGGNLACVASALYGIQSAVAISHKTSAVYNLAGKTDLDFRSIYHLSSESDQGGQRARWATELFEETEGPRKLELTSGSGHGVSIFRRDPSITDRIVGWLKETL